MRDNEAETIEKLTTLLDQERIAILQGNISKISEILDEKEKLFEIFQNISEPESKNIEDVSKIIHRNQDLLESSMAGIKAVSDRLATIQRVRESLEIYDQNGNRRMFDLTSGSRLEKRA